MYAQLTYFDGPRSPQAVAAMKQPGAVRVFETAVVRGSGGYRLPVNQNAFWLFFRPMTVNRMIFKSHSKLHRSM